MVLGAAAGAALVEESDAPSLPGFGPSPEFVTGRFHPYGSGCFTAETGGVLIEMGKVRCRMGETPSAQQLRIINHELSPDQGLQMLMWLLVGAASGPRQEQISVIST